MVELRWLGWLATNNVGKDNGSYISPRTEGDGMLRVYGVLTRYIYACV